LPEAVGLSKLLNIHAIDLGYFYRPAISKDRILEDPEGMAEFIRNQEITVPCLYHLFGTDIKKRNLSLKDTDGRNKADLEKVALFCRKANIETIFILPGVINPGQHIADAMHTSAENLKEMVELCRKEGVALAIEPHVHSYLESPELALELLDRVPGLKLILDYAHFVCMGFTQKAVDPLIPYAQLVHLRQAKPGFLQTGLDKGTINFPAILGQLDEHRFNGFLSVEYVHQDYMDTLYNDVLSETIKMRDLVEEWKRERMER
jgi:sugar phosphate isomerase/epimerase